MLASTELSKQEREAKPQIKIGHYLLKETLGVGTFGKVKGMCVMIDSMVVVELDCMKQLDIRWR